MYTLGINASFHDSAAALIKDGMLLAAVEDERFTRIKHGKRPSPFTAYALPFHAINYCLEFADITLHDIDYFAYSYDPQIRLGKYFKAKTITLPLEPSAHSLPDAWENVWDPYFLSSIINAPRHLISGAPHHINKRFQKKSVKSIQEKWYWVDHHLSHAASAFLVSPFRKAAIMTIDGRGEKATISYNLGIDNTIKRIGQVNFPHSLGILYENITSFLGFLHSSDEYKVMALASYGKPEYVREFRKIIKLSKNGQYTINSIDLEKLFGSPRLKGGKFTKIHFDIASSLQYVLEESVLKLTDWLQKKTHEKNLCLAGGVALNCVLNSRLKESGIFKNIWIQPAAGDAGTALGAAISTDTMIRNDNKRKYVMDNVYLGPEYSDEEIENFLKWAKVPFKKLNNIAQTGADLLARDKIIGWSENRMEFGPRSLGARSILASPINPRMQERLNDIKEREDFRPVAPVVLEEDAGKYFKNATFSPFMLFVYDVLPQVIDKIPAVRHVDGTARIQTINRFQNRKYYDLLKAFKQKTGVSVLVNTSFNTRSEPIVCSPQDAIECFWTTPLDALIIGSYLIEKPTK